MANPKPLASLVALGCQRGGQLPDAKNTAMVAGTANADANLSGTLPIAAFEWTPPFPPSGSCPGIIGTDIPLGMQRTMRGSFVNAYL
ncbi:hypothetical protein ABIB44_001039 [Hymenobacter sp. UYCo722]